VIGAFNSRSSAVQIARANTQAAEADLMMVACLFSRTANQVAAGGECRSVEFINDVIQIENDGH
jgi:hypothetical protein